MFCHGIHDPLAAEPPLIENPTRTVTGKIRSSLAAMLSCIAEILPPVCTVELFNRIPVVPMRGKDRDDRPDPFIVVAMVQPVDMGVDMAVVTMNCR